MPMTEHANTVDELDRIKAEHRALAILRTLDRSPGYRLNSAVLLNWMRAIALVSTRAELGETINNLERLGLVKTMTVDDLIVLELCELGQDVALGRTIVEEVLRPGPECSY
jgi:hypothetical protein